MDYLEKIKKLLALSDNPNEEEAKAALLKARKLMAEHKISDMDIGPETGDALLTRESKYTYTSIRDAWINRLAGVIAMSCCCSAREYRMWNKKTYHMSFVGLEDDVKVCLDVFEYAVGFIHNELKKIKNETDEYYRDEIKYKCNSYAYGFCDGINVMFRQQNESIRQEYGLVPVMCDSLKQDTARLKKSRFYQKHNLDKKPLDTENYLRGFDEGKKFSPKKILA